MPAVQQDHLARTGQTDNAGVLLCTISWPGSSAASCPLLCDALEARLAQSVLAALPLHISVAVLPGHVRAYAESNRAEHNQAPLEKFGGCFEVVDELVAAHARDDVGVVGGGWAELVLELDCAR